MGTIAGLRVLARRPAWRWWTAGSFLARLPVTMTLMALILVGEQVAGSVAVGAQLAGVAMASTGVCALWRGRMLDKAELTGGLRRDCLLTAAALAASAAAVLGSAPAAALFALAAVLGAAQAALSGGFRALLPAVVPPEDLPRANAVEAVAVEVAFVAGPAVAGVLALALGPVPVLGVMAASVGGAAVIVSTLPHLEPPLTRPAFAPWTLPGVRPVLLLALCLGAAVGMLESLIPARMESLGAETAMAGPLLALVAVGSGFGGLAASAHAERVVDVPRAAAWLLLAFGVVLAPPSIVPALWILGVALLLAGVPIAPLNALGTIRIHGLVPAGRQAEGFSLYLASAMIGMGLGQSVVGHLLPALGPELLLLVAAAIPLAAGVVVAMVRTVRGRRAGAGARPRATDPAR